MYIGFFIQNYFWNSAPAAIAVNLISPAAFAEIQNTEVQPKKQQIEKAQPVPSKPKESKTVTKKVPIKKKTLDVSQIKKSTEVLTKTTPKPVQQKTTFKPLSAAELAATLKKSTNSVKFSTPSKSSPNATVNPALMGYYDQLSSYLYSSWEQPAKFSAGTEPPSVLVKLFIDATGRLTNYQILKASGNEEMDDSVKKLLSSIDMLPAPPNGAMTIEASLILTN